MALRIRCPHCREAVTVEDDQAGTHIPCPKCQQSLQVPIPIARSTQRTIASTCSRCRHELAPGTQVCPRCLTDVTTGRRLSFFKRATIRPVQAIMNLLGAAALILGVVGLGWWAWPLLLSKAPPVRAVSSAPTVKDLASSAAENWSRRLFDAANVGERREARIELERLGVAAIAPVAEQLYVALQQPKSSADSERMAIELLGGGGDTHWLPLLRDASRVEGLRAAAERSRALLGDGEVLGNLIARWQEHLQALFFYERMQSLLQRAGEPSEAAAIECETRVTQQCIDGLRVLVSKNPRAALDLVLAPFWDSWSWLGCDRGEAFASAVFNVAMPERTRLSEPERVRAARKSLDLAAQEGSVATRAAAGLVLAQNAPQYESLRTRIVASIAADLPRASPVEQQRGVWTIARLTGQRWGDFGDLRHPMDADSAAISAALRWTRSAGLTAGGSAADDVRADTAYPRAPRLTRRVISVKAQLARDLLQELQASWTKANEAREAWHESELGATPALLALVHAGGSPAPFTFANVLVLAAQLGAEQIRPQLELWREAMDQPVWMRSMAACGLAAFDIRAGRSGGDWIGRLDRETLQALDSGKPGWEHFGRIIAAGGPRMIAELRNSKSVPEAAKKRLLEQVEKNPG